MEGSAAGGGEGEKETFLGVGLLSLRTWLRGVVDGIGAWSGSKREDELLPLRIFFPESSRDHHPRSRDFGNSTTH